MSSGRESDLQRAARRRLVRRASLFTLGFFVAAVVLAVTAGALIAWLLRPTGLPFRETWIGAAVLIIVVPLLTIGLKRGRSGDI